MHLRVTLEAGNRWKQGFLNQGIALRESLQDKHLSVNCMAEFVMLRWRFVPNLLFNYTLWIFINLMKS